eukprot:7829196-Pyramimonas_sp.AAC.1
MSPSVVRDLEQASPVIAGCWPNSALHGDASLNKVNALVANRTSCNSRVSTIGMSNLPGPASMT